MSATIRSMTLKEAIEYINKPVGRRINEIIVHHTWKPTTEEYTGVATVRSIQRYHIDGRRWRDIGYHMLVGPDGQIFNGRRMDWSGAHTAGRNAHSVGVCFIGNYDESIPQKQPGYDNLVRVLAALVNRFKLTVNDINFHRDYAPKSCPGLNFNKGKLREDVEAAMSNEESSSFLVVNLADGKTYRAEKINGSLYVSLRDLADDLGWYIPPNADHLADQGKFYVYID